MEKKENERDISDLLTQLRQSVEESPADGESNGAKGASGKKKKKDTFDKELSERLEKHLREQDDLREEQDEPSFDVDELEIVADGTLDPDGAAQSEDEEADTIDDTEILSDLEALMARMTPEQRAEFEREMNAPAEEDDEESDSDSVIEFVELAEAEPNEDTEENTESEPAEEPEEDILPEEEPLSDEPIFTPEPADEPIDEVPWIEDPAPAPIDERPLKNRVNIHEPWDSQTSAELDMGDAVLTDGEQTAEEEDEYELPEVEAFRALEARMTPEQREQFEQALREAEEAERAEKEARKAARRQAMEEAQNAESAENVESAETAELADENASEEDTPVFGKRETIQATGEAATLKYVASEKPTEKPQRSVAERIPAQELADIPAEDPTPEQAFTAVPAEEPVPEQVSETAPAEELVSEQPPEAGTDHAEKTQVIHAAHILDDDLINEESSFFSAEWEEDTENMPVIKVGPDEPSTFILVEEPEPEPQPEDEEEALAALLSRMSPEQLARFREAMMQEEGEDNTASEPTENVAGEISDPESAIAEEPIPEETAPEQPAAVAEDEDGRTFEEEPEIWQPEDTIPEEGALADEPPMIEHTDIADSGEESEPEEEQDPIAAILDDPEKLEALMARLSPEQAAELERLLHGEDDEEYPEDELSEPAYDEGYGDTYPADGTPVSEDESDPEHVLWSEPTESEPEQDKIPLNDLLNEHKTEDLEPADESTAMAVPVAEKPLPQEDEKEPVDGEETEEDTPLLEISEDMTDEEISLMLGLGYEKELVATLGRDRVEEVKRRARREDARDPVFADAYAYEGQEYRRREQADRIRYRYSKEKKHIYARLAGTALFALLLFLYECCGVLRGAFGGIFDPAHYPVIAIMAGWQLLVFAAAFSWKQLFRGIRSAFVVEPDRHAMTAVIVAGVMLNNILMAIVFKGSSLYLYNFPAALCLLCSVLCDLADVCREELTFEVISSDSPKYVAEAITLPTESTDMAIPEEEDDPLTQKNAMYVRRAGFVKNYFRRTNRKTRHRQILNFVFLPLLAFSIVMGIVTALTGNGTAPALSSFMVTMLLCMPMPYMVLHSFPLLIEARRLHKQGCAIVGESAVEEYNRYNAVIFEDKELFPPTLIKTKGLKLYENNMIYAVILKISLLFREIGGPINDVLDLDKEEMKRFLASGKAGALADGKVVLERMSEEGVLATLSDGSRVVAGSAVFLESFGIYVRPNSKDIQLLESGDMSILYLAFDGKLSARFYVDYQPDPEFEALAGMLHEDEFRVAVRTLDPGIHDSMIAHKCLEDTPAIYTVRTAARDLTDRPAADAKVDSGLVCRDDPRKMLLPLRSIRNLRRLHRFGLRLYAVSLLINVVISIVLTAMSVAGYMSSLFVSLYMLVWLITAPILSGLFLNK